VNDQHVAAREYLSTLELSTDQINELIRIRVVSQSSTPALGAGIVGLGSMATSTPSVESVTYRRATLSEKIGTIYSFFQNNTVTRR
jgi:hypothetical protein